MLNNSNLRNEIPPSQTTKVKPNPKVELDLIIYRAIFDTIHCLVDESSHQQKLLDDTFLYENLLQDNNSLLYLLLGMSSHQSETYQCVLRSTCWRNHRVDEHTTIVSLLGYKESLLCITHIKWDDRTLCLTSRNLPHGNASKHSW